MSVMAMNALVRRAITLVSGVDIYITADRIHMDVRCSVPWFKASAHPLRPAANCCSLAYHDAYLVGRWLRTTPCMAATAITNDETSEKVR